MDFRDAILQAVRRACEAAGVEFIDANGGGPGVRLRKSPQVSKENNARWAPTFGAGGPLIYKTKPIFAIVPAVPDQPGDG
jgi:hypothetical protein